MASVHSRGVKLLLGLLGHRQFIRLACQQSRELKVGSQPFLNAIERTIQFADFRRSATKVQMSKNIIELSMAKSESVTGCW